MWAFDLFSIFEMFSKCSQWFNGRLLYTSGKNLEIKESSRHWVSSPTAKENLTNLWWFSWEQQDWLKICYLLYVWSFAIPDPNRTRINSLPLLNLSPFTFLIKQIGIIIQRQTSQYTPRIDRTILLQIKNESCNMMDNGISILFRGWNRNRINGWKYQTVPRASIMP